jgi:hypothetical protein
MVVAVVAAPVNSLLTLSFATAEAYAGFPSAATSHDKGTAISAPDPLDVPDPPRDVRSDAQALRSIAMMRRCPAQERPGCAPDWLAVQRIELRPAASVDRTRGYSDTQVPEYRL